MTEARHGLTDQHAEAIHHRVAAPAGGAEEIGLQRHVDEVGHRACEGQGIEHEIQGRLALHAEAGAVHAQGGTLQHGVPLRRHAALARHQQHRIARQQPDEAERGDGDPDEGRDQQADAPEDEKKHFLTVLSAPSRADRGPVIIFGYSFRSTP